MDIRIIINYIPPNWNDYINKERSSYYIANKIKQEDKKEINKIVRNIYTDEMIINDYRG